LHHKSKEKFQKLEKFESTNFWEVIKRKKLIEKEEEMFCSFIFWTNFKVRITSLKFRTFFFSQKVWVDFGS